MRRGALALLCAVCLLAGCGGQEVNSPPEVSKMERVREESQPPKTEDGPEEEQETAGDAQVPADAWLLPENELRPYGEWVFQPEPYLVTTERYGELFSLKQLYWDYAREMEPLLAYGQEMEPLLAYGQELDNGYVWYGVPACFPFVGIGGAGLTEGELGYEDGAPVSCDEAYAMAKRYYSMAIEYDSPDGTPWVRQEGNYPQFCSWKLGDYRWSWNYGEKAACPKQPEPYRDKIELQAAEFNWIFLDEFGMETEYDPYGDNGIMLAELADAQNAWLTERGIEQRSWIQEKHPEWDAEGMGHYDIPESDRYYAATGLTILNGDSRTEETYFAGSRARDIRITVNGAYTKELILADSPAPQLISLDYTQPTIAKPLEVTIEILSCYPGERPDVYITEIGLGVDSNLPQGR